MANDFTINMNPCKELGYIHYTVDLADGTSFAHRAKTVDAKIAGSPGYDPAPKVTCDENNDLWITLNGKANKMTEIEKGN